MKQEDKFPEQPRPDDPEVGEEDDLDPEGPEPIDPPDEEGGDPYIDPE